MQAATMGHAVNTCPRQGAAPPPPQRHKVAMTYVHLVLGFSSTISMNEDAILGGGFERLSDAPRDSKFQTRCCLQLELEISIKIIFTDCNLDQLNSVHT